MVDRNNSATKNKQLGRLLEEKHPANKINDVTMSNTTYNQLVNHHREIQKNKDSKGTYPSSHSI